MLTLLIFILLIGIFCSVTGTDLLDAFFEGCMQTLGCLIFIIIGLVAIGILLVKGICG